MRVVLIGLPKLLSDDIKSELKEKNIIPDDIKAMNIRKGRYEDHTNYILYFKKGAHTIFKLREIKTIFNIVVRWNYYISKKHGPTQCRRCQMWGQFQLSSRTGLCQMRKQAHHFRMQHQQNR
jgi:hypothetical protein